MLLIFTKKAKTLFQKKSNVYKVTAVNNKLLSYNNRIIDHEMKEIRLQIRSHVWDMQFNITLISRHDVMLELMWLQNVNLKISF